ncbi:exodeoxyribonuclease VII small subunit [Roseateles sp. BYS180W]|uniref:Exodeoxyribonuclease 7 small subunit n=1 Tax=Roseateles rivi TaxID=3299028 RepID=A0ABW7FXK9_9BURK
MSKPTSKSKAADAAAAPVAQSFELALEELERLVADMDTGQLALEHVLTSYRRGAELLSYCRAQLQAVEQQVQQIDSAAPASDGAL